LKECQRGVQSALELISRCNNAIYIKADGDSASFMNSLNANKVGPIGDMKAKRKTEIQLNSFFKTGQISVNVQLHSLTGFTPVKRTPGIH